MATSEQGSMPKMAPGTSADARLDRPPTVWRVSAILLRYVLLPQEAVMVRRLCILCFLVALWPGLAPAELVVHQFEICRA